MFINVIVNRIKCFFDSIGWSKNQKRIKTNFEIGEYHFYVDMICGIPKTRYNDDGYLSHHHIEDHVQKLIESQITDMGIKYPHIDKYFNYISNVKDQKSFVSLKKGLEILISDLDGVTLFINKLEVKSKSDIRDEIINKVLKQFE